jgi:class 3 adenylate cyclase
VSLGEELSERIAEIFRSRWTTRDGRVVPESEDLPLDNTAVEFSGATVLYADISASTDLVSSKKWEFAAEIYKTFLYMAARIIGTEGGTVTAYDGDRVMAVFIGDSKNTSAARTALKINYGAKKILMPALKNQYPSSGYELRHVVGVDVSEVRIARTGVRGANDLVWVGQAANIAAKLTALSDDYASWITGDVYDSMHESLRASKGNSIWEERTWTSMNNRRVYRSSWWWEVK